MSSIYCHYVVHSAFSFGNSIKILFQLLLSLSSLVRTITSKVSWLTTFEASVSPRVASIIVVASSSSPPSSGGATTPSTAAAIDRTSASARSSGTDLSWLRKAYAEFASKIRVAKNTYCAFLSKGRWKTSRTPFQGHQSYYGGCRRITTTRAYRVAILVVASQNRTTLTFFR